MINRTFTDRTGRAWLVAESPPRVLALVRQRERRGEPRSQSRAVDGARLGTRDLDLPCLRFESLRERRELAPIPSDWAKMREDELEDLLGAAALVPMA